ncbi:SDR family oxidoreductase [Salisaeta longa]|uniref:SDR family oxidoreductase n=1 Tax=Salisaeta longa TaxID=503170 RepID=UPI0003B2F455|nr:SDR family oxidoreductase [Salisaeta longa]
MNQTIVITGCSSGFGYALALTLARGGDRVYATMRAPDGKNADAAQSLRDCASAESLDLRVLDLDVTSDASVKAAAQAVNDASGAADVVVNNAGQIFGGFTEAFTADEFGHQLNVNVVGVHRVHRAFLPAMRKAGSGLVINISSTAGRAAIPFFGIYHASKWGLEGYTQALRSELASSGVDVVLVEPGPFETELFPNLVAPEDADGRTATYPAVVHETFAGMSEAFQGFLTDPDVPTDPAIVVDAIAGLIGMAPGTRPFRTCLGMDLGVRERNALLEPLDAGLLESMGMTEFATLAVRDVNVHSPNRHAITFEFEQTATGPGTFAGTFESSGAISDAGTTEDILDVSSPEGVRPMVATFWRTVTGAEGTLVLTGDAAVDLSNPAEAKVTGTWHVEHATGAYADRIGSGAITGTADFTLDRPRGMLRYEGTLQTASMAALSSDPPTPSTNPNDPIHHKP